MLSPIPFTHWASIAVGLRRSLDQPVGLCSSPHHTQTWQRLSSSRLQTTGHAPLQSTKSELMFCVGRSSQNSCSRGRSQPPALFLLLPISDLYGFRPHKQGRITERLLNTLLNGCANHTQLEVAIRRSKVQGFPRSCFIQLGMRRAARRPPISTPHHSTSFGTTRTLQPSRAELRICF